LVKHPFFQQKKTGEVLSQVVEVLELLQIHIIQKNLCKLGTLLTNLELEIGQV
jgi:hypothetical protein